MREVGRCPNCGAKLPKGKCGLIKCEYCDSEFADETPIVIDDSTDVYNKMLKACQEEFKIHHIRTFEEAQAEYINQLKATAKSYREYVDHKTNDYVLEVKT